MKPIVGGAGVRSHVARWRVVPGHNPELDPRRKLTRDDIPAVRKMLREGMTKKAIEEHFGVSPGYIGLFMRRYGIHSPSRRPPVGEAIA